MKNNYFPEWGGGGIEEHFLKSMKKVFMYVICLTYLTFLFLQKELTPRRTNPLSAQQSERNNNKCNIAPAGFTWDISWGKLIKRNDALYYIIGNVQLSN